MAKAPQTKHDRQCKKCNSGRIETLGFAADGRPQYGCSNCDHVYTKGHVGETWDIRPRRVVGEECPCDTCFVARDRRKATEALAKKAMENMNKGATGLVDEPTVMDLDGAEPPLPVITRDLDITSG